MIKIAIRVKTLAILLLLSFGSDAGAQTEVPRIETGVQFTALNLPEPINEGAPGLGGRFTYNTTFPIILGWKPNSITSQGEPGWCRVSARPKDCLA